MVPSRAVGLARRPALPLILLLAAVYFVLGRLALLLAIPPGFACSVWPAAGVALMALLLGGRRLWPGVLLGSALVNLPTLLEGAAGVEQPWVVVAAPLLIGSGAALEALLGAWAIERWVGFPNNLSNSGDIFRFMTLGGPVSCLVGSTVGVAALLAGDIIHWVDAGFHWWTWWVGDTIGVLVIVPLVLALVGEPGGVWRDRRRRVGLPLVVAAAAIVTLFAYARRQEQRQLELELGQRALALAQTFEKHTDRTLDDLKSIEGLFAGSDRVSRREFGSFAGRILERNPSLQALSWNPRVWHAEREAYEAEARADGFPHYRFTEATEDGLTTATERPEYVVVHYIEPYRGNEPALGFVISSNPSRRAAIVRARDSGEPATTPGIRLVQETGEQTGVLILMPVYARGERPTTIEERRRMLRGYATGVLRVGEALETALEGLPQQGLSITLVDGSDPGQEVTLAVLTVEDHQNESSIFAWSFERHFGGRSWSLRVTPTQRLLAGYRRWYSWLVLAGGLGLVSLLGVLLLVQSGRAAELAVLNAKLEEGIDRRRRLEQRQRRLIGELELRNAELERFSYTVSHDLKSPLITIKGFLGLLEKDLAAGRMENVDAEIGRLHSTADRMRELVADLLSLSRAGHATGPRESLSLGDVASEAVEQLAAGGDADGVRIDIAPELPLVSANRVQLMAVLQNLLENAIKFRRPAGETRIEVGATAQGSRVLCYVRDNGIGVDSAHHERIFGLFSRLDQTRDGTGIGLAVVRRIVEGSGGSVWVESAGEGHGSTFFFTLPAG